MDTDHNRLIAQMQQRAATDSAPLVRYINRLTGAELAV